MNILKFIESFTDENFLKSTGSRRDNLTQFSQIGKNFALASVPLGLSALAFAPQKSYGATAAADTPTSALQLALTLEYLEDEFYQTALDTIGLIPAGRDQLVFAKISQHEASHVAFLKAGLGPNVIAKPTFDFTVGGAFDPFGDYPTFLALAQAFEDTGVRAYKGQAGNLISTPDLLTAALQIHSVEARHASEVRRIRGLKGWITGNERGAGMPSQTQAVYDGEENVNQAGFNTSTVNNGSLGPAIPGLAGSESFDEAITGAQAVSIASLFIV